MWKKRAMSWLIWCDFGFVTCRYRMNFSRAVTKILRNYHNTRIVTPCLRSCSSWREISLVKEKERERRRNASWPNLTEVVTLLQKRKIREEAEGSRGEKERTRWRKALKFVTFESGCRQSKWSLIPSFSFHSFSLCGGFVKHALNVPWPNVTCVTIWS